MTQTITSAAILGSRYTAGIQYRLFDGTTLGSLTNGTHLGNGIWRAVVQLPDAGGEVRWFANAGAVPLGIDVVDAAPALASGQVIAEQVWTYAGSDRALSGSQANLFSNLLSLVQAFTLGRHRIDFAASTTTQYNIDGTVRQVFNLRDKDGSPATNAQTAVDRVPQP
jgi:hypothetical protein